MATRIVDSPYKLLAREKKAAQLVVVLLRSRMGPKLRGEHKALADVLRPPVVRRTAEHLAGLRQCSEETWERVVALLSTKKGRR